MLWPPDVKKWLIGKDPDAGKDWRQEEKGTTEDEMVGWHHRLNGHEFEQAPEVSDGQGSLACCSPWSHRVGCNWATELKSKMGDQDWFPLGDSRGQLISYTSLQPLSPSSCMLLCLYLWPFASFYKDTMLTLSPSFHFKVLNKITSTKSFVPCKVTYSGFWD